MSETSIDGVIRALVHIIDDAERVGSRLGYFPALYRHVTLEVKRGIAQGAFEDGDRMAATLVLEGRLLARPLVLAGSWFERRNVSGNIRLLWAPLP